MTSKANGSSWISGQNPAERVLPVFQETTNCKNSFAEKVPVYACRDRRQGLRMIIRKYGRYIRDYREKEKLTLPCAFDSVLWRQFDVNIAPYVLVIDPKGIVRETVFGLDSASLSEIIHGKPSRSFESNHGA